MARALAQAPTGTATARKAPAPTYATLIRNARMAVGASVTDRSGVERLDLCNADGAVILGWADARVENAIANAADHPHLEAEAAERLAALMPAAEAVAFRDGLNAALADALYAAKTLTGRDGAFFCDDETVASGDHEAVAAALDRHAGEIAALVVRPMEASAAFLHAVRKLTARDAVVLVFDESRTLLRLRHGGAQALHNVAPDMTVVGASIANGRAIGAVAGKVDPMRALKPSNHAPSTQSLAACAATLQRVVREDACDILTVRGAEIEAEVSTRLRRTGADRFMTIYGDPSWSLVAAHPRAGFDGEAFEAALAQSLCAEGVLSFGAHVPSLATNEAVIARLLEAYDRALPKLVARAEAGEFAPRPLRKSALAR